MKLNFSLIASVALFVYLLIDLITRLGERSPAYVIDKSMIITFIAFFVVIFSAGYFTRMDQEKLNKK